MITQVFLFMNADIDIIFPVSQVAIAINGKRESGFGQSIAGKKNVLN